MTQLLEADYGITNEAFIDKVEAVITRNPQAIAIVECTVKIRLSEK
jgi:hypothetical protein